MAKINMSKIAAIALAGATALSTVVMSASATLTKSDDGKSVSGTVYKVVTVITDTDGIETPVTQWYTTESAAKTAAGEDGTVTTVNVTSVGSTVYISGGIVYDTETEGATAYKTTGSTTTTTTPSTNTAATPNSTYRYYSSTIYYSRSSGFYYPNLAALQNVEGTNVEYFSYTTSTPYSSTNRFFDPETGKYTSTPTEYGYAVTASSTITTVYRVNNKYYRTYSEALAAANNIAGYVYATTTDTTGNYFSHTTGKYYTTYNAAYAASGYNVNNIDVLSNSYDDYYNYYYGLYGDYYNYYGSYGYADPYYYYWLNKNNSSSSSSKDTTTATIGNKKGWTSIAAYLKKVSTGSSVTVDMNNETVIPSSVTSAIKGRNVTVKFVLDNGVTFTVNGKDVTTAKDVDIDTTYNTKSISTKLIKAAYKKNDAVSSAQLSIDAGTLGFTSDLTVKFSSKRSGYKAKLYRYNSAKNSLQLVDTATIGSTGKCNFDKVTKGGEFVIVIYK